MKAESGHTHRWTTTSCGNRKERVVVDDHELGPHNVADAIIHMHRLTANMVELAQIVTRSR